MAENVLTVCGQAAPISLKLALSGTTFSASYSDDGGTSWTELDSVDMVAAGVDPTAEWSLSYAGWGVDATWGAPATLTVDEISVTYTPPAADSSRPQITILGDNPGEVVQGGTYVDAGATAEDNVDGDITSDIITVNTVDESTLGDYTVTYTVYDAAGNTDEEIRTVTVFADAPPAIMLIGDAAVEVVHMATYTELGAAAVDYVEGDLSGDIVIGGDVVDETTLGTYTVTYDVSDSAGLEATQVTRTVTVVADVAAVITLEGAAGFELLMGEAYTEDGYAAIDDLDGDISANVVVGGDVVDPNTLRRYVITYTITDSVGNTAVTTRTVKVVEEITPAGMRPVATFGGSSDEAKFPASPENTSVRYGEDTISFTTYLTEASEQLVFDLPLPGGAGTGVGDFESYLSLAMADIDYLAGWYHMGLRVDFGGSDVDIRWEQDSAWPIDGPRKCIRVYSYDYTEDILDDGGVLWTPGDGVDPVYDACDIPGLTGDLSLKIASAGGVLTLSYSPDVETRETADVSRAAAQVTWTDVYTLDMAATAVAPTTPWSISVFGSANMYDEDGGHEEDTMVDGVLHYAAPWAWLVNPSLLELSEIGVDLPPGPAITLNGGTTIALEVGVDVYTELGATAADDLFGDLADPDLWTISGGDAVDTDTVGTYLVTYDVSNPNGLPATQVTRTVNVSERPVITLHGPEEVTIIAGTRYWLRDLDAFGNNNIPPNCDTNPDATPVEGKGCFYDDFFEHETHGWSDVTVMDGEDGEITLDVVVDDRAVWTTHPTPENPNLDLYEYTGWVGEYEVSYNATDSAGLAAVEVVRTIHVVEPEVDPVPIIEDDRGLCFIGTASQDRSGTPLIVLVGLVFLGLAARLAVKTKESTR